MSVRRPPAARPASLLVLCLAQFMLILDVAVVNVALPSVQRDLGLTPAELPWVGTAYLLAFGGALILAGRAGDLYGRRRLFLVGLATFTLASVLCGLAQTGWQLLMARGLQGLGAAIVSPAALALLTAGFAEGEERNRALGIWGVVASGGAVAGQLLGGALTDLLDWRWIFLVNLPLGLLTLGVARRVLTESRPAVRPRLDLAGAAGLTAGLVLLTYGITRVQAAGLDRPGLAVVATAVVCLLAFVGVERLHPAPLVRLGIVRNRRLVAGNLIAALNAGAAGAAVFFATLYLQQVLGAPPLAAGAAFAPITLVIMLVSGRAARLVERFGVRALLLAGAALSAAGMLALSRVPVDGSYLADVLPGLLLVALGMGLAFVPSTIAATAGVGADDHGLASGLLNTSLQLGGAIGLAVLATLAAAAGAAAGHDPAVPAALVAGYRAGYLGAAALCALTLATALLIPRPGSPAPAADITAAGRPAGTPRVQEPTRG